MKLCMADKYQASLCILTIVSYCLCATRVTDLDFAKQRFAVVKVILFFVKATFCFVLFIGNI